MVKVAPSVLSANFAELKNEIDSITECKADWIHYDVMDGHFVPNISFGYSILKDLSKVTDLYLDVHLMISDPKKYVDEFIKANASLITFHVEAMNSIEETNELIDYIHSQGCDAGISIKPNTPVSDIEPFLDGLDLVLVMSVEPGKGGQAFIEDSIRKINQLYDVREKQNYNYVIEVDGGINDTTIKKCYKADICVVGSFITKQNYEEALRKLRD